MSPDGRYVYYTVDATAGQRWAYNKNALGDVYRVRRWDLQTGEEETIIAGPGGAIKPTPSHNGKYLAYVKRVGTESALAVKNLRSGVETEIYTKLDRDLQESNGAQGNTPAFAWTPDDKEIVFWAGGTYHKVDVNSLKVTDIPMHVKAKKEITKALRFAVDVAPDKFKVKMARWTQISPDGKTAMFQALGYIYLRDLDSGKLKRLTKQSDHFEYYPSFSRDGKHVVYTTWDDQALGTVRIADVRRGRSKTITTEPGHYIEPGFSPDGKSVLYRKIAGGSLLSSEWSMRPGIYIADAKGGNTRFISKSGHNAHFGKDGKRLYFVARGKDKNVLLKSVNLQGNDEREHYKGKFITDYRVSPDGKWLAFTQYYNIYVTPFIQIGKTVKVKPGSKDFPVKKVTAKGGSWLNWRADGQELSWGFGPKLYRRKMTDTFAFLNGAPESLPEPEAEGIDITFEQKADKPEGLLALVGGKVVTMRDANNTQEVIEDGVVLIENNRIKAVGKRGEVDIPRKAKTINVSGKTVIPGLIDVHAHASYATQEIQPEQSYRQYSYLAFGVTTTHDPSSDTSEVFSMAELTKAGKTVAPRIYSTGRILYAANMLYHRTEINNLEDAKFHVGRLKEAGAISVKSYNHPRRETRQQVLTAAREMGMMVMPEGGMKHQENLSMVLDGHTGLEHSLPVKYIYDDIVQMWGQTEVGYTPTFTVSYGGISGEKYWYMATDVWKNERLMRYVPESAVLPGSIRSMKTPEEYFNHINVAVGAKKLRDAGVTVHIGAHGQREGLAAHWELWMMGQGGFSGWEALRAGTIDGARYIGVDNDVGSIEVGKLADLAVIEGDPVADIRQSEFVAYTVINGRIYDTKTMNEIGNYDNKRQKFYFEGKKATNRHPANKAYMERKAETFHWKH